MDNIYKYDIYKPYTGIEGLKGLNYIPKSERELLVADIQKDYPYYTSDQDLDNVFSNRVYIATYGEEAFKSKKKQDRDKEHYSNVVNTEFLNRFGDSEGNLPSELSSIYDPEARYHILTSTGEAKGLAGKPYILNIEEDIKEEKKRQEDISSNPFAYRYTNYHPFVEESYRESLIESNNSILEEAVKIQQNNLVEKASPITNYYRDNILKESFNNPEYCSNINNYFNELMNTTYTDFQGQELNVFNMYKSYEDQEQLKDFSYQEKVEILSLWQALNSRVPEGADENTKNAIVQESIDIINSKFRDIINENTGVVKTIGRSATRGAGTKALSQGRIFTDIKALLMSFNDDPRLPNYLRGLDEEGNELPWWDNIDYWNKVDQYGTLDRDEQKLIDKNGGVSPYKYVRASGEEYNIWNLGTLSDATEMIGYALGSVAIDAATAGTLKGVSAISKASGATKALYKGAATLSKGTSAYTRAAKAVRAVDKTGELARDVIRIGVHTIPETGMEASNVYNDVYNYGMQQLYQNEEFHSKKIEELAYNKFKEIYGEKQEKDIEGNPIIQSPEYIYLSPEYLVIKEQVGQEYLEKEKQKIEDAAIKAFNIEYATKGLSNALIDSTWKKYMFSKDLTYGKTKALINEDYITETAENTAAKKTGKDLIQAKAKQYGKLLLGGGTEEVSDEMWNRGAIAVGYNTINNYNNAMRSPESEAHIIDWASNFYAWNHAAIDAVTDPSTVLQGVIGALSPFAVNINPVGGLIEIANAIQTGKYNWSSLIFSPLLAEYMSIKSDLKNIDLALNGDKGDNGLNSIITNQKERLQNAASSLHIVDQINKSEEKQDITKNWITRFNAALKFVSDLSNLGHLGNASSLYNDYIEDIERIASGNITQEDGAKYDSSYGEIIYDEKGNAQFTDKQQAINQILQENANTLINLFDSYNKVGEAIQARAMQGNKRLSNEAYNELLYQTLLSDYASRLQGKAEQHIIGRDKVTTNSAINSMSKKALDLALSEIDATILELEKKIELYSKKKNSDDTSISKYVKNKTIKEAKKQLEELKEEKAKYEQSRDIEHKKVLTKEEIKQLDPIERAKVVHSIEVGNGYYKVAKDALFTQEERNAIEYSAAISESLSRSKDFLNAITDDKYIELLNYNAAMSTRSSNQKSLGMAYINATTANKFKKSILKNPYKTLATKSALLTKDVVDILLKDKQISTNSKVKEALEKYKEKLTFERKVVGAIEMSSKAVPLSIRDLIANSLLQVSLGTINESQSRESIEDWLKSNMSDPNVDDTIKQAAYSIYNNLRDIEKTGNNVDNQKSLVDRGTIVEESFEDIEIDNPKESVQKEENVTTDNKQTVSVKDNINNNTDNGIIVSPNLNEIEGTEERKSIDIQEESLVTDNGEFSDTKVESGEIIGNVSSAYNPNDLTITEESPTKRLNPRVTMTKGDSYESFMSWAQENGFEYQKVVDNILGNINAKYHPKVYYIRPFKSGDKNADNTVALVVELTDDIRNDKSIVIPGKTLKAWDTVSNTEKEYIVIGQAGYTGDANNFNNAKNNAPYSIYSDVNNTNTYYVNSNSYTRVQSITSGVIANARGNDQKISRSINELLNDPSANPNRLTWNDLVFGFATRAGVTLIGDRAIVRDHRFYHPEISDSFTHLGGTGLGNVFVYIPSANGNYIPVYIPFKRFGEISTTSKLYSNIEQLVDNLLNGDLQTKRAASAELSEILYTSKESNQYIGVTNDGNFYIRNNAYRVESTENPTKNTVLNILKRFYINYNSAAFDKENFNLLNDAGAFNVDIISLSTYNAQFKVYSTQGQADNFDKITENNTEPEQKIEGKVKNNTYVEVAGIKYNKVGDSWVYTDTGNKVTNTSFTDKLDAYTKAVARGVTAIFENKVVYVTENGDYIYQDTDGKINTITMLSETIIEEELDSRRDKEATEELQNQETVDTSIEESQPEIPSTSEEIQENLNKAFGEQQEESKEIIEEKPKKVDNNLDNSEIINSFAKELDSKEDTLFELGDILEEKGLVSGDYSSNDVAKVLVNMGISIENLDSIDTIKDIIKNCR